MIVTTSNKLLGVTPTIQLDAGGGQTPAHISDPDHSLTYTSGSAVGPFRVSFGAQTDISYVAISGHNSVQNGTATINIYDDATLVSSVTISRNHNLVITFDIQDFTDLRIVFHTNPDTQLTTVSYIAAGTYLEVPRGEQAGYTRQWLARQITSQVSTNLFAAPTAITQRREALKGSLRIPNQYIDFIEGSWQDFIDFTYEQPFFIREDDTKEESSYICFDPKHDIKAHAQTRTLVDVSLSFSAYNGL